MTCEHAGTKKRYSPPALTVLDVRIILRQLTMAALGGDVTAQEMLRERQTLQSERTNLLERGPLLKLKEAERQLIVRAVRETGGDKARAAQLLGIGKTKLYRKLKEYEAEYQRG